MRSATPSMAARSGGSPPPRSLCHKVSEPCGSQSISRTGRDGRCAWAARWAVNVLFPEPPLRDAKTMTFMRAPLGDSPDQGTTARATALWSAAAPQPHPAAFSPQNQGELPNGTAAEVGFYRTSRNRRENELESKDELRPAAPAWLPGLASIEGRCGFDYPAASKQQPRPRTSTEGNSHAAHHPSAERQQCP